MALYEARKVQFRDPLLAQGEPSLMRVSARACTAARFGHKAT